MTANTNPASTLTCTECGMVCEPVEFHPFAACLMFKGCHDGDKVRANLAALRASTPSAAPMAVGEAVALREALLAVQMDAVRLSREEFCISEPTYIKVEKSLGRYSLTQPASIRLANVPAMARDDRAAFKSYLDECEEFAIVPDVAGAFNAGWQASAHPPTAQVAERQPLTGWQPIETCPQTGFFLVTEDTAVRALWRYEGKWESPDFPGIEDGYGDLIVGDDAKRLTGGRSLVVSQGVREPHHWMHVPEGIPLPDEADSGIVSSSSSGEAASHE